jgi:anti-anti-sigma factor
MEAETKLVLDLSELDYISSSGLQVLLLAAIRAKDSNRSIVLASMKPQVKQVLDYAGFAGVFQIAESVKKATGNP